MTYITLNKKKLMTLTESIKELNAAIVSEAVKLHKAKLLNGYIENENMYMSDHGILHMQEKEVWKPDNRLVVNYAKYIVDTFSGYQIGVPIKFSHDEETVDDFIQEFRTVNDMEDNDYELAKMADVFGHAFLYVYQDENSKTRVAYNAPTNMLLVHDNTIEEKPIFAVRYSMNEDNTRGTGQVITNKEIIDIEINSLGEVAFKESNPHIFSDVPVVELIENEERQGIFDSVKTLINGMNKAISEKANDVDYFADSYLKIIGMELEKENVATIREDRIFNLWGDDGARLDVGFLERPSADTTQENLIDRLKENIFTISMVANLSDEDFGGSSGVALAYKLQAMDNLARTKDRKMQSAFNRLYKIVFSVPKTNIPEDAYSGIRYQFTRNVPRNILEESQVYSNLVGKVSKETAMKVLSIVDNAKDEIDRIEEEEQSSSLLSKQIAINERRTDGDLIAEEE